MEYDYRKIEQQWQEKWKQQGVYKVNNDFSKPKYYVLDMFPYPSGTGLHILSYGQLPGKGIHTAIEIYGQERFTTITTNHIAGTPPTISKGFTSFVTTAPAATTAPRPIVTPGRIIARGPTKT